MLSSSKRFFILYRIFIALAKKQSPPVHNEEAGSVTIVELCGFPFDDGWCRAEGLGLEVWLFYHLQHEAGGLPAHFVHIHLDSGQGWLDDHGKGIVVKGHEGDVPGNLQVHKVKFTKLMLNS